jgi:hypothetical protein
VQAGDFGDLPDTPMAAAQSLAARDPTSLLFVEAAEDQIEVPMIILLMTRGSTNPVTSLRWLARS